MECYYNSRPNEREHMKELWMIKRSAFILTDSFFQFLNVKKNEIALYSRQKTRCSQ